MAMPKPDRVELLRARMRQNGPSLLPPGLLDPVFQEIRDLWHAIHEINEKLAELDGLADRMAAAESTLNDLEPRVKNLETTVEGNTKAIQNIVNHVYGGGEVADSGSITWGDTGNIPSGNISIFSQTDDPSDTEDRYIKCRDEVLSRDIWIM